MLGSYASAASAELTPVKLQLKWHHQFQFAGYYAALEQGYYRDAGLDVTLLEAQAGKDPIRTVLSGEAQFGVGTSELMLNAYHGDPVVVLAAIMQHSPLALAVLKTSGISNIHQLASQALMIEPNSSELFAYFKNEGIQTERLKLVPHSLQTQDLLEGRVKGMSVYSTDETFGFDSNGIEYTLFSPSMSGIDFYGDNLFTTQTLFDRNPELVARFRQASLDGWKYAMRHPDEMVELILSKYTQRKSPAHLRYEAQKMYELMRPELVEIGYINPGRWQHIAYTYHQLGLLPEQFDAQGMLYQPDNKYAYEKLQQQFYWALGILLLVMLLAAIFYRQYHLANVRRKQFETLFLNAPISLLEIDQNGRIHNWNKEAENIFQYASDDVLGRNVFDLLVPSEHSKDIDDLVSSAWKGKKITHSENINVRKDGQTLLCKWANMPIETVDKDATHVICMARDITHEKAMEEQLYQAANFDELTGLPNRALVMSLLKEALADAKRHHTQLAVLFIDLNEFKPINDTYGHLVGDEVLRQSAARIRQTLRENDLVGRLSGDEFLVVIKDLDDADTLPSVIDKLQQAIQMPIEIEKRLLHISASIGTSFYPQHADEVQKLIRIADQAMYKVKSALKQRK
ncbi:diguanylate cyclase domain-containing protein [Thiomicrorhabdus cannonii]|uniref:diguanylate cyclase domain-containing protein n=1 Tax=Thiomicrorhabdus cannonii TaxID=2748011 RepID=UPI0015BDF29E|nr:diguanylate cyclase [Thiomicrorhabdus cannonii]